MRSASRFLLLLFTTLFVNQLPAQEGGYFIQNHLPKEYKGFNQMWHATQDKNGLMYFGCTTGIFVYDGVSWDEILVKERAATRQIVLDSSTGTIYVGSIGEFGYLAKNAHGELHYVSLVDQLSDAQKEFVDVWKVYVIGKRVYFQASEGIYIFEDRKLVKVIESPKDKTFALSFVVNGKFYVRQRNVGLMELKNDELVVVPGSDMFGTIRILGMLPYENGSTLVLSGDQGFFTMSAQPDDSGSYFKTTASITDDFLENSFVLGCIRANDSTIAVNTRSGIGFYSRDGKLKEKITKETGLSDESISSLYLDREQNLWAMHNNGISRVAYNCRVRSFDDRSGYLGMPETMCRFKGKLFLATSEGIAQEIQLADGSLGFQQLSDFRTETWTLLPFHDDLLVGTSNGLYVWKNNEFIQVTPYYTDRIALASENNREFITMEKLGTTVVRCDDNGNYSVVYHYNLVGEELMHCGPITEIGNNYDLWAVNRFRQVLHMTLGRTDSLMKIHRYDTANGLQGQDYFPAQIGDSIYLFSPRGCQVYVPSLDKDANSVCFRDATGMLFKVRHGFTDGMKMMLDSRLALEEPGAFAMTVMREDGSNIFSRQVITGGLVDYSGVQNTFLEANGNAWVLTSGLIGLVKSDLPIDTSRNFRALIRYVSIGGDSATSFALDEPVVVNENIIPFNHNSIRFSFAAPYFMFIGGDVEFMYKLEGFDTAWTKTTTDAYKEYTNLPEGTYVFHVAARNTYNMHAHEASYTFTIAPPWYRTGWAYTSYVILFIVVLYLSVRISATRLRRQKEKLEAIVKERTAEVVEQKEQIEVQKAKLEGAYTDIQDSIHYAERIQNAILPMQQDISTHLPESFIYFRPRNIVSGDFYWFTHRDGLSFLACVDCTGHGVPGAFMSLIGNTLLNQIVIEKKMNDPGTILDHLHEGVRHSLKQDSGGETRDGMDICLVVIDHQRSELQYAGANRALWFVRNGEFNEIKADKYPIAGDQQEEVRHFTSHRISMLKGDTYYMSTDGYADQFGGDRGKKFMVKQFQKLILGIQGDDMRTQKSIVEKAFIRWQGEYEQVDDVLVIGFKYIS